MTIDKAQLKALAEAATPGPWSYDGSYVCPARIEDGTTYVESWRFVADCHQQENTKFIAAANPYSILELLAEIEGLHAQHSRDSGELRKLCSARDSARRQRDQLKAENETLKTQLAQATEFQPIGEACLTNRDELRAKLGLKLGDNLPEHVEALRKDAERYRWLKGCRRSAVDLDAAFDPYGVPVDESIDEAIAKEAGGD